MYTLDYTLMYTLHYTLMYTLHYTLMYTMYIKITNKQIINNYSLYKAFDIDQESGTLRGRKYLINPDCTNLTEPSEYPQTALRPSAVTTPHSVFSPCP